MGNVDGETACMTNEVSAAPNASTALESKFVYAMAVLALMIGLPMGYLLRGSNYRLFVIAENFPRVVH